MILALAAVQKGDRFVLGCMRRYAAVAIPATIIVKGPYVKGVSPGIL